MLSIIWEGASKGATRPKTLKELGLVEVQQGHYEKLSMALHRR